ncbi:tRNA pseudouridine synthase A [subsurface metagenome]
MAVRNIKLTIAYDGSEYHGWQTQPGKRTIQESLTQAIQDLIGSEVRVFGASRTDAGVSALGQVALTQIDSPIPTENLAKAITHRLPPDIAVTEAVEVPQGFNVISAVKSKLYRYTIFTGVIRPVLQIRHCWHLPAPLEISQKEPKPKKGRFLTGPQKLDLPAMAEAAKIFVGKKDFKSFASADDQRDSSVRTIFRCDVTREGDLVYVDVEGDGFLYNMVRNIVGTLVEVGVGRMNPGKIPQILKAKDRTAAGPIAPAAGLCLMWIKY